MGNTANAHEKKIYYYCHCYYYLYYYVPLNGYGQCYAVEEGMSQASSKSRTGAQCDKCVR